MMDTLRRLSRAALPQGSGLDGSCERVLTPWFEQMALTPQEPSWHGEGDVMRHTEMVCRALVDQEEFKKLGEPAAFIVFLAAVLHDIGKVKCTRYEDGKWIAPGHASLGAREAREILWRDFGFCGNPKLQDIRESVCALIRNHSLPLHVIGQEDAEYRLIRAASSGELAEDFTIRRLCMLSRADIRGRICSDMDELYEAAELCEALAEEYGCADHAWRFASSAAEYAYMQGRNIWRGQELYDDTWGEVILMSGQPGTGKDTWIRNWYPHLPVVSLDEVRRSMGIAPTEPQGTVAVRARELAKEYLRKKQPFVWNATDTTRLTRKKQIDLFHRYGARVRIVFLETGMEENLRRNASRRHTIPETVIFKLLKGLEPPLRYEAEEVEWNCV